jgi:glyoxylase-like metal-dependent hydrolase (beta-lactamase superfamily II)
MKLLAVLLFVSGVVMVSQAVVSEANAQSTMPLLSADSAMQVSPHVYAMIGFPNIAIVVGDRATLVVDTGMGTRNGATVLREAEKLSKKPKLFLTTTHFHPEHAMGVDAFPADTILIRPTVQQQEMDQRRDEFIQMFSKMSAQNKELLTGLKLRTPDLLFDREVKLDLGGVTSRLFWLGTAHTRGDEMIFVEQDSVLIPGDIVQSKLVPNMPNDDTSPKNWIAILDQLAPLKPRFVVPDHGALGDGSLITQERAFLVDVQTKSLELKRKGTPVDEAGKLVATEMKTKYPDWNSMGSIANIVKRVYAEAQ